MTFIPDEENAVKLEKDIHSISAFNHNMSIYTHSYLKMGLMAARKEILTLGKDKRNETAPVEIQSECINPIVSQEWTYAGQNYIVKGPKSGAYKFIKAKTSNDVDEDIPIIRFEKCKNIVKDYVSNITDKPHGLSSHKIYAFSYYFNRSTEVNFGLKSVFNNAVNQLE